MYFCLLSVLAYYPSLLDKETFRWQTEFEEIRIEIFLGIHQYKTIELKVIYNDIQQNTPRVRKTK